MQLVFYYYSDKEKKSCVAERMPILGYVAHSIFYMAWVYPVIVHWTWGGGWLN
jgi:ammonia channel protein AmtB